jgi:hypothetical protein
MLVTGFCTYGLFLLYPRPCVDLLLVSVRILGSVLRGVVPRSITLVAEMFVKSFPSVYSLSLHMCFQYFHSVICVLTHVCFTMSKTYVDNDGYFLYIFGVLYIWFLEIYLFVLCMSHCIFCRLIYRYHFLNLSCTSCAF